MVRVLTVGVLWALSIPWPFYAIFLWQRWHAPIAFILPISVAFLCGWILSNGKEH